MERRRALSQDASSASSSWAGSGMATGGMSRADSQLIWESARWLGKRCKTWLAAGVVLLCVVGGIVSLQLHEGGPGSLLDKGPAASSLSDDIERSASTRLRFQFSLREQQAYSSDREELAIGSMKANPEADADELGSGARQLDAAALNGSSGFGAASQAGRLSVAAMAGELGAQTVAKQKEAAEGPELTNESIHDLLEQDRSKCPLQHDRFSYEDIRTGKEAPYLLGARAKPACINCDRDLLWSHFCRFQTHGPICPGWLKWQISGDWIQRAEAGSPGMKEMLTMTPCDLFPFLRDRTLWLVGDSLTLEWDKAVHCFLYEFWEDLDLHQLNKIHPNPPSDFQGWCGTLAQGSKICFLRSNTGDQFVEQVFPNLAGLGAKTTDIMVLNFAIWQNTDDHYVGNVTRFAHYYARHKAELPITVWRDSPVQHFDTHSGDYIWPIPSEECKALRDVELQTDNTLIALEPSGQVLAEGGWRNKIALPVMAALGIPVIHTWNQSLPMWQYHTNFNEKEGDCTHMCHPSEYQYWVFELFRVLRSMFPELAGPNWI